MYDNCLSISVVCYPECEGIIMLWRICISFCISLYSIFPVFLPISYITMDFINIIVNQFTSCKNLGPIIIYYNIINNNYPNFKYI